MCKYFKKSYAERNFLLSKIVSLFIVFALVILAFWTAHTAHMEYQEKIRSHFEYRKYQVLSEFNKSFDYYYQYFTSVVGLYKASEKVTEEEWFDFLAEINLSDKYPAIDKIAYAEYNEQTQSALIKLIQSNKGKHNHLIEDDLWQNPNIKLAMQESHVKNMGLAFPDIPSFTENNKSLFFVSFPVVKKGVLEGFIIGTIAIHKIIEPLMTSLDHEDLTLRLYSGLRFVAGEESFLEEASIFTLPPFHLQDSMNIDTFGQRFTLFLETTNGFSGQFKSAKPLFISIFCFSIIMLLSALLFYLFRAGHGLREIALKKSNLLRNLLQTMPLATAVLDTQMRYVDTSLRWKKDYDLIDRGDIRGLSIYAVSPEIEEEKPEWKAYHYRALRGEVIRADENWITKQGKSECIKYEIRPIKNHKEDIEGIVIFSDVITNNIVCEKLLEEYQEKFRIVFENSFSALALVSLEGEIIKTNKAFLDLLDISETDMIDIKIEDIIGHENKEIIYKRLIEDKDGFDGLERLYVSKKGNSKDIRIHAYLVEDRNQIEKYFFYQISLLSA